MKKRSLGFGIIGLLITAALLGALNQAGEDLFQKALRLERNEGNLEEAIVIYQRIINESQDKALKAQAQLRIGLCYEKLGKQEAQKAFQKVIDNYPNQLETVKVAREKLASLLIAKADVKEMKIRKVLEGLIVVYSSVSPDGRYYAYPDWEKGGNLAVRNFATGKNRILTEDKGGFAFDARWSPDGKKLAYTWTDWSDVNIGELRSVGLEGSGSRIIFKKQGVHALPFDWSLDGKHILASFSGKPFSLKDESVNLGLVSGEDGSIQILKTFKLTESFQSNRLIKEGYFSPDGLSIAYTKEVKSGQSIQNDIFLFSIGEKKEIPMVKHPADEYLLGWSPDGKHLLFASNRTGTLGVWTVRVSELGIYKDPVLIRDNMGSMIPLGVTDDGSFYYGLRNDLSFIFLAGYDHESGKIIDSPRKLSLPFEGHNSDPCFSPDGNRLAYRSDRGVFRKFNNTVLCVRNLKSGENTEFDPMLKYFNQPRWSPDGSKIHVVGYIKKGEWTIYSIDPQTEIVESVIPPEKDSKVYGHCWSKNGNSIYYLRVKAIAEGSTILNNRIIHRDLETGREDEIGSFQSVNSTHELFGISPDGKILAYVQRDTDQGLDIINVIPVTGGNPEKICILDHDKHTIRELAWSSDSRFILFASMSRLSLLESQCEIMRVSADGGEPEKLGISMDLISYLSIHPDGRQIAFSSKGFSQRYPEIWVMENFLPKDKDKK